MSVTQWFFICYDVIRNQNYSSLIPCSEGMHTGTRSYGENQSSGSNPDGVVTQIPVLVLVKANLPTPPQANLNPDQFPVSLSVCLQKCLWGREETAKE